MRYLALADLPSAYLPSQRSTSPSRLWNQMNEVVGLIDAPFELGVNFQANDYPYIQAQIPLREAEVRPGRLSLDGRDVAATMTAGMNGPREG